MGYLILGRIVLAVACAAGAFQILLTLSEILGL